MIITKISKSFENEPDMGADPVSSSMIPALVTFVAVIIWIWNDQFNHLRNSVKMQRV